MGCNASRRRRIKEIGKRMEETTNDSDRMFLLSLLPVIKQLSAMDNLGFRVEDQENLRRPAAQEFQLVTYQITPSAAQ